VHVSGTGFAHRTRGALLECNLLSGQPTTTVSIASVSRSVPVGCTEPAAVRTSSSGTLGPRSFTIQVGTLGSWESGIDSAGNPSTLDSAGFPCPPTAAQQSEGDACGIVYIERNLSLTRSISFRSATGPTTTTTVTSTTVPVSTTTQPCDPVPATATATSGSGTLTVDPGTCLVNGGVVSLTGSGFADDSPGTFQECNNDPNQPTVSFDGNPIPVSCTNPLSSTQGPGVVETSSTGDLGPSDFTVDTGTVGPPCGPSQCTGASATDSSGGNPVTDAAAYPCPPTPAQMAAGDTCVITFHDNASDAVTVPISFNLQVIGCSPGPATASATSGQGTATVTDATCLVGGDTVSIAASGLTPASPTNYLGTFIECNDDPEQPTFSILGNTVPVSCTPALKYVFTPNAAGTASMPDPDAAPNPLPAFAVGEGTVGPPCSPSLCDGNDSAGNSPYSDAANFPCPPTPAQVIAGDSCIIAVGDTGGDQIAVPIQFASGGAASSASASASARRLRSFSRRFLVR
ncbi:MAG: hypothetical protein ACRDY1_10805, partial [Acidimicrobiales bacterium]